ncbi:hypothetical protein V1514DRAFT_1639 [Lipomyces japonicus]|uniref:uncharacterized protein n=1 Tax=Lipomyces japonicus TaxID=56871 RepID=UPI0034CF94C7
MAENDTAVIDSVVSKLETTTIGEAPVDFKDDTVTAPVVPAAEIPIEIQENRRLYVGNLAYSVTDDELQQFFAELNPILVTVSVNPRNNVKGNAGYGFVDLASAEDAQAAIEQFNGKSLADRVLFVRLALPQSEVSARRTRNFKRRVNGRVFARRNNNKAVDATENASEEPASTEAVAQSEQTASAVTDENAAPASSKPERRRKPIRPKRTGPKEGTPSTTTVYVANLSYNVNDDGLREFFSAFEPEWVHVATRRLPAHVLNKHAERGTTPRLSRGYGFVRFAQEEQQKKSVEELNGKELDGRTVSVKIAVDSPNVEVKKQENEAAVVAEPAAPAVEASA